MTAEEIVFSKLSSSEDSIPSLKSLVKKYANEKTKTEKIIIEFEFKRPLKKRKRRKKMRDIKKKEESLQRRLEEINKWKACLSKKDFKIWRETHR